MTLIERCLFKDFEGFLKHGKREDQIYIIILIFSTELKLKLHTYVFSLQLDLLSVFGTGNLYLYSICDCPLPPLHPPHLKSGHAV